MEIWCDDPVQSHQIIEGRSLLLWKSGATSPPSPSQRVLESCVYGCVGGKEDRLVRLGTEETQRRSAAALGTAEKVGRDTTTQKRRHNGERSRAMCLSRVYLGRGVGGGVGAWGI